MMISYPVLGLERTLAALAHDEYGGHELLRTGAKTSAFRPRESMLYYECRVHRIVLK